MDECKHVKVKTNGLIDRVNNGRCEDCGVTFNQLLNRNRILIETVEDCIRELDDVYKYNKSCMSKLVADDAREVLARIKKGNNAKNK